MFGRGRNSFALSRRHRAALAGIGLIGAGFLVWLDRDVVAPRWSATLGSRQRAVAADIDRYARKRFGVLRVIDGDTLHLDIADGRNHTTEVKLLGIDAPDMANEGTEPTYFAQEATAFTQRLTLGRRVTVYFDDPARTRNTYGALVAYIELPDGRFLNEELVREGYAHADLRFRHSYLQKYTQLQTTARSLGKGLWADVSAEQLPLRLRPARPSDPTQD